MAGDEGRGGTGTQRPRQAGGRQAAPRRGAGVQKQAAGAGLTAKEARRLDLNSQELGVPVRTLMANAGKALADAVKRRRTPDQHVVLLCGKGNNGGDGFAAAGLLERWGIPWTVVLLTPRDQVQGGAAAYLGLLPRDNVVAWKGARRTAWKDALVVDCMLGTGVAGTPRPPYDAAIRWLQKHPHVIACDVPSGWGTKLSYTPKLTVTFHAPKQGMEAGKAGTAGKVEVAPIGIPKAAETDVGLGDLEVGFLRPRKQSHKGDNGRVLVVGGGPYTGAPHYTGMAAMRAGADLVHVAAVDAVARVIACWGPDLIIHDLGPGTLLAPVHVPQVERLLDRVDTVALGPGLGTDPATREAARDVLEAAGKAGKTIVVDADGLDAVDAELLEAYGAQMVLTPHGGEFKDLSGWQPTPQNVAKYAKANGVVVLRKGATDVISDAQRTRSCRRGHPAMTVGGTGDVLTGLVAALLSKGAEPFDAACAAAYLNGCAGELAAEIRSYGITATDVHEAVPLVLRRL